MVSKKLKEKLKPLVEQIKSGDKKLTFFQGAGISTGAGIPDFRSPKTGLYANLAKLNLPYAEAVFDIDYFKENPDVFYVLAEELYPGKFSPTKFHHFIKLLQDKNLLKRVYTQNIDTLERIAGVEDKYIVEAHGSFARNHCIDCSEEVAGDIVKDCIYNKKGKSQIPLCPGCKGFVKPDIVFFGEGLPERFFSMWESDLDEVEIAIVAGTSLTVYPFASLPSEVNDDSLRVLINKEVVGDFKSDKRVDDIIILEDCDVFAETLCELLGWELELAKLVENGKETRKENIQIDQTKEVYKITTSTEEKTKKLTVGIETDASDDIEKLDADIKKLNI